MTRARPDEAAAPVVYWTRATIDSSVSLPAQSRVIISSIEGFLPYVDSVRGRTRRLAERIPRDRVEWTEPSGGFLIWLCFKDLDKKLSDHFDVFLRHRVAISAGTYMFLHPAAHQYARLSISSLDEAEIEEGIRRLARAVRQLYR